MNYKIRTTHGIYVAYNVETISFVECGYCFNDEDGNIKIFVESKEMQGFQKFIINDSGEEVFL